MAKQSFKDKKGREWTLRIDGEVICQYEDLTGIDLFASFATRGLAGPVPGFHNLMDLLYLAAKAEDKGVSKDEFRSGIYGEALTDSWKALNESLCSFFPALRTFGDGLLKMVADQNLGAALGAGQTFSNMEPSQE